MRLSFSILNYGLTREQHSIAGTFFMNEENKHNNWRMQTLDDHIYMILFVILPFSMDISNIHKIFFRALILWIKLIIS